MPLAVNAYALYRRCDYREILSNTVELNPWRKNVNQEVCCRLAAGLVAVACATPVALAADPVTEAEAAVKSAQLDVDYYCSAESEYYDMAKCADAEATLLMRMRN